MGVRVFVERLHAMSTDICPACVVLLQCCSALLQGMLMQL